MKKNKIPEIKIFIICALVLSMIFGVSVTAQAASKKKPGRTVLTSISSSAYNEITITWETVPDATAYYVFYKEEGAAKWTKLKKTGAGQNGYTHISSKRFPIIVGKNYTYTVRAYNHDMKKKGAYDKKGLTTRTLPNTVKVKSAVWNYERTEVTVSWKSASGGNYYRIYRKTGSSSKWKRIASVKSGVCQYVDQHPVTEEKSRYIVRAYYTKTKALGETAKPSGVAVKLSKEAKAIEEQAKQIGNTRTAGKTDQIILVAGHNLSFWEKDEKGTWIRKLSVYCGYGANGLSADRHEGDRTTPIGSFPILHGFGKANNPGSRMEYRKITSTSYWSGEPSTYNQWVETSQRIKGEHLIDYYQYKYAMAIGFNRDPVVVGKGSAIFLHCKSYNSWNTAGCVSVEESVMKQLLQMSRNGVYIVIVRNEQDISNY